MDNVVMKTAISVHGDLAHWMSYCHAGALI